MRIQIGLFLMIFSLAATAQDTTQVATYQLAAQGMDFHIVEVNQRYGIVNDTGLVVLPIQNSEISFFADPEKVDCSRWENLLKIRRGNRFALAELSGRSLTPMAYERIELLTETCEDVDPATMVCRVKKNGKYGLLNINGDLLVRCSYDEITLLNNDKGQLTIPAIVRVKRNGKYGCMVLGSQNIIPSEYEQIDFFDEMKSESKGRVQYQTWLILRKDGKYGLYNTQREAFLSPQFDRISAFSGDSKLALISKGKKFGLLSTNLKLVAFGFDDLKPMRASLAPARKGKRFGAVDARGKPVVDFKYDDLTYFLPGQDPARPNLSTFLRVRLKGKVGIFDDKGVEIISPTCDRIRFSSEKECLICTKGSEEEEFPLFP
ncbi:MAG: WG repeat-containing protein [Bacteroidota bacterium]